MTIKTELLKRYIFDYVKYQIEDFEIVEKIIYLFECYNIDTESCHDF